MQLELDNMFIQQNRVELESLCKEVAFKGIKVLEIGSWKGNSTSVIASTLKDFQPQIYCIDTWKGSEGETEMMQEARQSSIFSIFKRNLELQGLYDFISPIMIDSREAYKILPDSYFDIIFVDGNHTYDFSYSDIKNYLPKLKPGGVMCGDDCEEYFSNLPGDIVEKNKNNDWTVINGRGFHCGVITALHDIFNDNYNLKPNGSTFWWKQISKQEKDILTGPSNLVLVFGYQIDGNEKVIKNEFIKGSSVVALDISAAYKLKRLEIPYILFDQLINDNTQKVLFDKSLDLSFSWYQLINDEVTYKGINLAELDLEAMRWYWYQFVSILELCNTYDQKIGILTNENPAYSLYYYKNDSIRFILEKAEKLNLIGPVRNLKPKDLPAGTENINYRVFEVIKDKYVFVLHPGEYYRYSSLINLLYSYYGSNLCVIMLFPDNKISGELKKKYNIEVLDFVYSKAKKADIFVPAKDKLLKNCNNPVTQEILIAKDQINYLLDERWPVLINMIDSWEKICQFNPKVIIGSNLVDAESQVPLIISSKYNIPAVSIPHGISTYRPYYNNGSEISYFFSFTNEIHNYLLEGYDNSNLHLVNELQMDYEYHTSKDIKYFERSNKILVLLYPAVMEGILFRYSNVLKQIEAIRDLIEFQKSNPHIEIKFKLHPGFSDKEMFGLIYDNDNLQNYILPLDSDLYDCLEQADLVICVNSTNAAAIHTVRMKKPVMFYWNNSLFLNREKRIGAHAFFSSMYVVDEKHLLYSSIKSFFNNTAFSKELISLSEKKGEYLNSKEKRLPLRDAIEHVINPDKKINKKILSDTPDVNHEIKVSIIIPTFNRSASLTNLINSIFQNNIACSGLFEVIVVDNGSTDETKEICSRFMKIYNNFSYVYEPEPGLLSGRHAGAYASKGDILTFVDDDIIVTEDWLTSIIEIFENKNVHLAGGPSIPLFEATPPEWMLFYFNKYSTDQDCGYLSLLNHGDSGFIDPIYIWGLNFSIRKETFLETGGFNPDNITKEYQYFQGDGETGLSLKLVDLGYKTFYSEKIKVFHNVYSSRMTEAYFRNRAFYEGVCDSYAQFRKKKDLSLIKFPGQFSRSVPPQFKKYEHIYTDIHKHYMYGFLYHQFALRKSEILQEWVLREDYRDYHLPKVEEKFHNEMLLLRNNLQVLDQYQAEIYSLARTHQAEEVKPANEDKINTPKPWTREYYSYRAIYNKHILGNSDIIELFRGGIQLPDYYAAGLDERSIEYPWFFSVRNGHAKKILDAGSALNHPEILDNSYWSGKELTILTLAPEGNKFNADWIKRIYADLRDIPCEDEYFDQVVCISTLEHVGMDNTLYTGNEIFKENRKFDFLLALKEMNRVLKPNGKLFLTVPFGKYINYGEFQQFDNAMLDAGAKHFGAIRKEEKFYYYTEKGWKLAENPNICSSVKYSKYALESLWGSKNTDCYPDEDGAVAARAVACCMWQKGS